MPERLRRGPWWLWSVLVGFGALLAVAAVTAIDLTVSAPFYASDLGWRYADAWPWNWLFEFGEGPAIVMACGACAVLIGSVLRPAWRRYRRACLVIVLTVTLGPGLVVNGILKPYWGRPRPRQVTMFGGTQAHHPWWRPGGPGSGASFPSGHAAMGFALLAGAVLLPQRLGAWRHAAIAAALGYGALMGCGRIVQGGHYVSDVLWSGVIVALLTYVLWRRLIPNRGHPQAMQAPQGHHIKAKPRA